MANIKSAKKRIRVSERRRLTNKTRMSDLKTYMKKLDTAIENEEVEVAQDLLKLVDKKLKKSAHNNLIHDNKASRLLGRYTQKVNKLS